MISYQLIPQTYVDKNDNQVYYYRHKTLSDGSKSKYVYIHPDEKHQIMYWINRLVIDVQAKRVIDKTFLDELDITSSDLPSSKVSHKKNTYMTYAAGVVSNIMRNPAQDLSYDQLKYIKELYRVINRVYSLELADEVGYNNVTKQDNPVPKQIKFKQA